MSIVVAAAAHALELSGLRPYLMRVALSRMRDHAAAEDVVQDTLAAACAGTAAFGGRSSLRTWVTGILLHKVTDAFRAQSRQPLDLAAASPDPDEAPDFTDDGRWRAPVTAWSDPETALACRRFRETFEALLASLPPRQARAYSMRELQGLEADQVCAALGITEANLHVLLHRARLALRAGLDRDWFDRDAA